MVCVCLKVMEADAVQVTELLGVDGRCGDQTHNAVTLISVGDGG